MLNNNFNKKVFIAKNCNRTATLTAANLTTTIASGEIVILDSKGNLVDTAAKAQAAEAIMIAMGTSSGAPRYSGLIYKNKVLEYKGNYFVEKQEKKTTIGYNGTSGSISVNDINIYSVAVEHLYKGAYNNEAFACRASYESPFSGTYQYMVAVNISNILEATYSQFNPSVRINVVSNSTVGSASYMTGSTVTSKSKTVKYTAGTPTIGTYISIPGITGQVHRDEDNGIYKIIYVDSVNKFVELDKAYQNRSSSALTISSIADVTNGDWGITLEAEEHVQNSAYGDFTMNDFVVTLGNFGDTTFDDTTMPSLKGFGRHEQTRTAELFNQGYVAGSRQPIEYQNPVLETIIGNGYSMISITFKSEEKINTIETNGVISDVNIYLQRGTYQDIYDETTDTAFLTNIQTGTGLDTVNGSSVLNVLNAFMVSAGIIATGPNTIHNGGKSLTPGITDISNKIDV